MSIAEVIAIKGKIPRLQRIFDRFNATEQEQKVVTFLFNPVQASYFDSPNDRYYSYRDSNETMKIFELSQVLNLDVSVVIQVLTNSKFADEKFFKLKDSSQDPYGYGYDEEDQAPPGTNDAKFITPLHNVGIKKVIKQILMGANPNSSAFIALSSKTLQVLHSLLPRLSLSLTLAPSTPSLTPSLPVFSSHLTNAYAGNTKRGAIV